MAVRVFVCEAVSVCARACMREQECERVCVCVSVEVSVKVWEGESSTLPETMFQLLQVGKNKLEKLKSSQNKKTETLKEPFFVFEERLELEIKATRSEEGIPLVRSGGN